jgi:hypothetical protein
MTKPTTRTGLAATAAFAETSNFDADLVGALPAGWTAGVTGGGSYHWEVAMETGVPGARKVLKQSARGDFPWCVRDAATFADGYVEVKFKPLAGNDDQAGGVVWRWKDGANYYVARANALENNVALYYTRQGRRNTIQYVAAPVATNQWHALRIEFDGTRIAVTLDGRRYIEQEDSHIAGAGAVGVWTKADSVTVFTDFSYGRAPK